MKIQFTIRILAISTLIATIAACGSTEIRGGVAGGQKVSTSGRVCYMPIQDGKQRNGETVAGSGVSMTAALRDELLKYHIDALPLQSTSLAKAQSEGVSLGCDKIIHATITEWQDYATEWSGKGDSIALSAEMYDIAGMKMLSTSSYRKKASAVAFVSKSPERFETIVANNTIAKLFGMQMPKS